jgi:hypothetical protein
VVAALYVVMLAACALATMVEAGRITAERVSERTQALDAVREVR